MKFHEALSKHLRKQKFSTGGNACYADGGEVEEDEDADKKKAASNMLGKSFSTAPTPVLQMQNLTGGYAKGGKVKSSMAQFLKRR